MNHYISVNVINESGYKAAIEGIRLYRDIPFEQAVEVTKTLASKDGGHNKFLESIYVWLEVIAPRYWWQEADTYRLTTKQSESSMHTLKKELGVLRASDNFNLSTYIGAKFEYGSVTMEQIMRMIEMSKSSDISQLKRLLPEGYLQTRIWCLNYKTLRNIILQRRTHRLPHWKDFIAQLLLQVNNPELLPALEKKM